MLTASRPIYLAEILDRGRNNFDLVRLIAALTVIFGHSFSLFPTGGTHDPVSLLVNRNLAGTIAVGTFFFVSGLLISQSFQRWDAPVKFMVMRMARIYPGSIVCLLIIVFVAGSVTTSLPLDRYIANDQTSCYLRDNWSFLARWPLCATLPGVFADNFYGPTVNGALWTLQPEIACYAYVLILGRIGCLKSSARIVLTLGCILVLHALAPGWVPYFSDDHYSDVLKVGLSFMAGVAAFSLRNTLPIRPRYAVLLVVVAGFLQNSVIQEYALYTAVFYSVLVVAASTTLRRVVLPGDYSFGVYIYGFPIQQTVQHFIPWVTSYPSNLICMPAALIVGGLSWHFIEQPALRKAHAAFGRGHIRSSWLGVQS